MTNPDLGVLAGRVRATELSRLSGQHKQVIGTVVDELESLARHALSEDGIRRPHFRVLFSSRRGSPW